MTPTTRTPDTYITQGRGANRRHVETRVVVCVMDGGTASLDMIPDTGRASPTLYFTREGLAAHKRAVDAAYGRMMGEATA